MSDDINDSDFPSDPEFTPQEQLVPDPSAGSGPGSDHGLDSIVEEFLIESNEGLDQLDRDLVKLEQDPTEPGLLSGIFRAVHTIKGTCGFFGYSKLESIAHVGENLLSKMRDGQLIFNQEIANSLLAMVDAIRQIISSIETCGNEGDVDYSELVETLTRLNKGESLSPSLPVEPSSSTQPAGASIDESMAGIVEEFLLESYENLDQLDRDLVELEKTPGKTNLLASIFRTIHTIKGACGFLGLAKLESVSHVGETLLSKLRDGELIFNQEIASALLALVDAIRQILSNIESSGGEGSADYTELVKTLESLLKGENALVPASPASSAAAVTAQSVGSPSVPEASVDLEDAGSAERRMAVERRGSGERRKLSEVSVEKERRVSSDRRDEVKGRRTADSSIRVDVGLLDGLMNLVGELVLARNQILQFTQSSTDAKFAASSQTLNLITSELQERVMKTRLQPIRNIWDKFPRVVRDLAISCGKKVRLEMIGKETELDKTLIEAIKDPLTHIVRNAVDHGIGSPEERERAGKNPEGLLVLKAYHEGGMVNVDIRDDGGGINPEILKAKALAKNLITEKEADRMSVREMLHLIFMPGFSTAATVTNVSGRGVGMDVVKTNIEKIGGTVDVQSTVGQGTTLKVKIPLTLAIVPALIITCAGNRYAIPQASLVELVRLDGDDARDGIEMIQDVPVYRLRGNLLPLVELHSQLGVLAPENKEIVNLVVVQADDRQFGLIVEGVNDTEEIVVKPLGKQLSGIPVYSGATIMGDGKVALILDVMGISKRARLIASSRLETQEKVEEIETASGDDRQTLLIFGVGTQERMALPLSKVARLEEIKRDSIERSGEQDVVQYRGEIMPLIYLSSFFGSRREKLEEGLLPTIVCTSQGRSVGLVVDDIVDIVEESISVKRDYNKEGVAGSVVARGRVTDLLDFEDVIRRVDPSFFEDEMESGVKLLPNA